MRRAFAAVLALSLMFHSASSSSQQPAERTAATAGSTQNAAAAAPGPRPHRNAVRQPTRTGTTDAPGRVGQRGFGPLPEAAQRQLDAYRDEVNAGMVGIASGGLTGTYARIAAELADELDGPNGGLRVFPILGRGSLQNIWDIVFARGVDIGLVQSDVLAYAKREKIFPGIDRFIQYIAHLYDEEVHVLAGKDIQSLQDLAGKKVNLDKNGSGTEMTAGLIFAELGVSIDKTSYDQEVALEKLKNGEISALVFVAGKPVRLFSDIAAGTGLHFLSVLPTDTLKETYGSTALADTDYPNLIPPTQRIDTLDVGTVMAVYAWPQDSERYRKVARFVDAFFSHAADFQNAARHPKWRQLDLAERLPGWTRFPACERWLKSAAIASGETQLREQFNAFLAQVRPGGADDPQVRQDLFRRYVQWRGLREGVAGGSAPPPPDRPAPAPLPAAEGSTGSGGDIAWAPATVTPRPPATPQPHLGAASLGPDQIRAIQSALHDQGLYDGPVDGIAGPETEVGVIAYQTREGLPQRGFQDAGTLERLMRARVTPVSHP